MNLDDVVLSVVKVIHVTMGLLHKHALNQLASGVTVTLADCRHRSDLLKHLLELRHEELPRITVFAPPEIFGFEPLLCLIE
jgi:hypothetical protein